jgi:hypothetical protein
MALVEQVVQEFLHGNHGEAGVRKSHPQIFGAIRSSPPEATVARAFGRGIC